MEHTGYLGTSRVVLNHYDVSTQADIQHVALSYESEDEMMARLQYNKSRHRSTPHYSKQDIREQYCISDRGLGALENNDKHSLFGCLSSHHSSPCSNRSTFLLTACVRQKVPSDENIYELYRRNPNDYAPFPRRQQRYPWSAVTPEMRRYDEELKTSYFRRKPCVDPSRYTWMPSDDESVRMEKPKSILDQYNNRNNQVTSPPTTTTGKKHVSFARSHTLTSFDDAISSISSSSSHLNRMTRSQERLLDVRKIDAQPITKQPEPSENILIVDKIKRTPMKTQATQTEACLGRKPIPPSHINLSPRTISRVKMVSQGAQTNGLILNGRKLIKSYSEAGTKYGIDQFEYPPTQMSTITPFETILDHEPLQRTQSDEPPRSPFIITTPPPLIQPVQETIHSDSSSLSQNNTDHESDDEDDSAESKKEIFIDFKPQTHQQQGKLLKRPLIKTVSDGEILLEHRKIQKSDDSIVPDKQSSISHENIITNNDPQKHHEQEKQTFVPYFQKSPIRHEGICKQPLTRDDFDESNVYSSIDGNIYGQDSIDEEFHENLIYNPLYMSRKDGQNDECIVPSVLLSSDQHHLSPFASNDSLSANDLRDQSDGGIWNESQATVLQLDSGTDNGTALSSSEMTSSPGNVTINLLTPSSRRKHLLLLQHQQRSSIDTEALDEEYNNNTVENDTFPRIVIEKPVKQQQNYGNNKMLWRGKKLNESPTHETSPLPAIVPDLLLARTDSCKTNTDLSESTTTDDYITANSGTDSSRKSGSTKGMDMYNLQQIHLNEGSSIESTKGYDILDDMVVPTFSPSNSKFSNIGEMGGGGGVGDVNRSRRNSLCVTPVPQLRTGRSTPSEDSSSSCGSYSVDGSTPDLLLERPSAGYYESPMEDDVTWKSPKHDHHHHHHHKKRPYTLEIKNQDPSYTIPSPNETTTTTTSTTKYKIKRDLKQSPSGTTTIQTTKRSKSRTRSPQPQQQQQQQQQQYKKSALLQTKKPSPQPDEYYIIDDGNKAITSDESSCEIGLKKLQHYPHHHLHHHQVSPSRKLKKIKDINHRRKSLPRSPTSTLTNQRATMNKRNDSDENKSSSLPGSLSRRKSSKQQQKQVVDDLKKYSPSSSPSNSKRHSPQKSPESATKLKALSAESLRSVSPGSDSVFYSDPSCHTANHDHQLTPSQQQHQVHCLHCGKEVDIVTTDDPDDSKSPPSSNNNLVHHHHHHPVHSETIVQPPAGFEDSPRSTKSTTSSSSTTNRLYKKLDRRIKSEDRVLDGQQRRQRCRPDNVRAKSEERDAKTLNKGKLRPMAKSTNSSQEVLKATDSSPSVLPGEPEDDDDNGVYDVPYNDGCWIYIDERDEVNAWNKSFTSDQEPRRRDSVSSTESEQEFRKRYQSITHRMVHRKSCLEMYKRQSTKSFANGYTIYENQTDLRNKLEEILKLMLVIWCRENEALNIRTNNQECDKTVTVHRESGEFGFRIHGSKPVVVSAIEPGTPAETSGLEVGDIVLAVNGISVLDKSHSEVVKIAHAGSDTLTLEVARTCYALNTYENETNTTNNPLYSGYLWKLSGYASGNLTNKWIRRWFVLKENNCLYYYKTDSDKQPVGVIMLYDHKIEKQNDDDGGFIKQNRFVIKKCDSVPLYLATDTLQARNRWFDIIQKAICDSQIVDEFLEETKRNLLLAPNNVLSPDCFGYLVKLGTQWKAWSKRYCVLKNACLYFYQDANSKCAFGVAYLHGYRVQQTLSGSKKHAFEIIPPDPSKKHYYFHTESDADRKRWIAALEYSIDRWLKIQ